MTLYRPIPWCCPRLEVHAGRVAICRHTPTLGRVLCGCRPCAVLTQINATRCPAHWDLPVIHAWGGEGATCRADQSVNVRAESSAPGTRMLASALCWYVDDSRRSSVCCVSGSRLLPGMRQ